MELKEREKEVVLCWLPSHIGIEGNEAADQAAKKALRKEPCGAAIPHSDLLPISREHTQKEWQKRWNSAKDNKLRAIMPLVSTKQNFSNLTRNETTRLTRLRIGHSRLTHGHLMQGDPQPVCLRCNVALTVEHLVLSCRATKKSRDANLKGTTSMHSVFENTDKKEILNFLRETKIFEKL